MFSLNNLNKPTDLDRLDITPNLNRNQGRRFILASSNNPGESEEIKMQDAYIKVMDLSKNIKTLEDCKAVKTFIGKLIVAENLGENQLSQKSLPYKILTAVHRFFGKTPWSGTHLDRLQDLENELEETTEIMAKDLREKWLESLENVPEEGKFLDVLAKSEEFQAKIKQFPTIDNQIATLSHDPDLKIEIIENAKAAHVLIDIRVSDFALKFLSYKLQHGTRAEKALYQGMTVEDLFKRLQTKRPLVFYSTSDISLAAGETEMRFGGFEEVGQSVELSSRKLKDFLTYDEMLLSANLLITSPTLFINAGKKGNLGIASSHEEPFHRRGILIGVVGARLEKEGVMEESLVIIKKDQNISPVWKEIFSDTIKTHFDAEETHFLTEGPDCRFIRLKDPYADQRSRFNKENNDVYFDKVAYRKIMEPRLEAFLKEANAQAFLQGKKAYLHLVGLGLNYWLPWYGKGLGKTLGDIQRDIYQPWSLKNSPQSIGTLDFCNFPGYQESIDLGSIQTQNNEIKVLSSKRNPADKLDNGELLCVQYEWDSNSFPGNEYWRGKGFLSASNQSIAACSSTIAELQNPLINENVTNLYIYK